MEKLFPNLLIAFFYTILLLFSWMFIVQQQTQPTCPFEMMKTESYNLAADKEKNTFSIKIPEIASTLKLQVNQHYYLTNSNLSFNVIGDQAKVMTPQEKKDLYSYLAEAYTTTSTNSFTISLFSIKSIEMTANTINIQLANVFSEGKEGEVQIQFDSAEQAHKMFARMTEFVSSNSFSDFVATVNPILNSYEENNSRDKAINNILIKIRNYGVMEEYINQFNNLSKCADLQNVLTFLLDRQSLADKYTEEVKEETTEMQKFLAFLVNSIKEAKEILGKCKDEVYYDTVKAVRNHITADKKRVREEFRSSAEFFADKHDPTVALSGDLSACRDEVAGNEFFLYRLAFILERILD